MMNALHTLMRSTAKFALCLTCVALLSCDSTTPPDEQASASRDPQRDLNVIVISFDAFRADRIAAYGGRDGLTPNLDRFADQAVVFSNAYTAGQATPTSFAAAFTGRPPHEVFRGWQLSDTQTLAKVFQRHAFVTGGFMNNAHLSRERGFDQGFDEFHVMTDHSDRIPIDHLFDFLDRNQGMRFFAWLHLVNPHSPYEWHDVSSHLYETDYQGEYQRSAPARIQSLDSKSVSARDHQRIVSLYDGEVFYVDYLFGQIFSRLEQLGLVENTIIVVTADHGEAMNEHGDYGHAFLHESVIRIPLIIRTPDKAPAEVGRRVSNMDLLPSLANALGLEFVPELVTGEDWNGSLDNARMITSSQLMNRALLGVAAISGTYKYIGWCTRKMNFAELLFDLDSDPGETLNLIDDPDFSSLAGDLYQRLEQQFGAVDPCAALRQALAGVELQQGLDEDTERKLRSLGYIQ